jgi:hypothetical protein
MSADYLVKLIISNYDKIIYLKRQSKNACVWNCFSHICLWQTSSLTPSILADPYQFYKFDKSRFNSGFENINDQKLYLELLNSLYLCAVTNVLPREFMGVMKICYETRNNQPFSKWYPDVIPKLNIVNASLSSECISFITDINPSTYKSPVQIQQEQEYAEKIRRDKEQALKVKIDLADYFISIGINDITKAKRHFQDLDIERSTYKSSLENITTKYNNLKNDYNNTLKELTELNSKLSIAGEDLLVLRLKNIVSTNLSKKKLDILTIELEALKAIDKNLQIRIAHLEEELKTTNQDKIKYYTKSKNLKSSNLKLLERVAEIDNKVKEYVVIDNSDIPV